MTRALLEPSLKKFNPIKLHAGKTVFLGLDLSRNKDLTAKGVVVKTGEVKKGKNKGKPKYDAWVEIWTPGDTMATRELADELPYTQWAREGYISAPKGKSISYRHVAQSVAEDANNYDVGLLAYDAYAFESSFVPEVEELGLDIPFAAHPQGGVKKGRATEEMKSAAKLAGREPQGLWMPGSIRQLEDLLLEGRIRILTNPALISAIMSAVTDEDRWGNYWLAKERSTNKIDPAIALAMAVGAAAAMENAGTVSTDDWIEGLKE